MGRVKIRFVQENDASLVQTYASDAEVAATCNLPHPYPDDAAKQWIDFVKRKRESGTLYAFCILFDGNLVGVISIVNVDRDSGSGELGYWIGIPYWNKGIGTKAVSELIKFCFGELKLNRLEAVALDRNPASGKVLEKNGFTKVKSYLLNEGKFQGEMVNRYKLQRIC